MCGITGAAWTAESEPLAADVLQRMVSVLAHRGPDDSGTYDTRRMPPEEAARAASEGKAPGAALGHRRLSIIDLECGHQPLANEDETVWIVFNGEIYNYRELHAELEAQGHRFRTHSDTETIVHLYEQHGTDCVRYLGGMFAFAIWDSRRSVLFLARDRIGQKPLIYRLEHDRLLFASELKSLLQVPGLPRKLSLKALDDYLTYQYVPYPECILEGYHKLPPAHWALYDARRGLLQIERYWRPPYTLIPGDRLTNPELAGSDGWSAERWRSELRRTLTEAVRLRMRSDVPIGAFLSGGIDSTIISGLMQQLSERPIHTFSIGFPIPQFDERSYAREAAAHLGTQHHEYVVEPSALEILPRLIWQYDEPFADSSAVPTMYLSRVTRQEVTVALSGDGGDELFAGYERYRAVELAARLDRLPRPLRGLLGARIWQRVPASTRQKSFRRRAKRFLAVLSQTPERRYLRWVSTFDDVLRRELLTEGVREQLAGHDSVGFLLAGFSESEGRDFVTRTTAADVLTYLPCDILTKVDIASMSYGLEARSPFLDHHVAELAARMPIGLKMTATQGKRILIDTFADLLPESIQRRSKMGFGIPINHWFKDELKPLLYDVLLSDRALGRGYFEPAMVRQLVDEHLTDRWDHGYRLWALLCFELWQRTFLDPAVPPSSCPGVV